MTAYVSDSEGRLSRVTEGALGHAGHVTAGGARKVRRIVPEGVPAAADLTADFDPIKGANAGVVDILEVGLGKPLCLEIKEVYTGHFPKFWTKDLIVTTAVKSRETFDAQPRALNILVRDVSKRHRISIPAPTEQGTPYAFYSPALVSGSLSFQIEFVFDEIPDQWFEMTSRALKELAGIPMFVGAAGHLLAGSALINLGGNVLNALFDHRPAFRAAVPLDIHSPGVAPLAAGWYLLTDDAPENRDSIFDPTQYQIDKSGKLLGSGNKSYSGAMPYATMLVDGTERKELVTFAPTAVSADLLSRFFGNQSPGATSVDAIVEATKLYSDMHFVGRAKEVGTEYAQTQDSDARKRLQKEYDALQKNIRSEDIRRVLQPLR
jgi:hypothetical protein